MILLETQSLGLSELADWAQVVIASINLYFAGYLLLRQLKKDTQDKESDEKSNNEKMKLDWVKELVIRPHLSNFFAFFENLTTACQKLRNNGLSDFEKGQVNTDIKDSLSLIRKQLVDLLLSVNINFHTTFRNELDLLVDNLTNDIFSSDIDLTNTETFTERIVDPILNAKRKLLSKILDYKGN